MLQGSGYGAMVALHLAANYPARVTALVLTTAARLVDRTRRGGVSDAVTALLPVRPGAAAGQPAGAGVLELLDQVRTTDYAGGSSPRCRCPRSSWWASATSATSPPGPPAGDAAAARGAGHRPRRDRGLGVARQPERLAGGRRGVPRPRLSGGPASGRRPRRRRPPRRSGAPPPGAPRAKASDPARSASRCLAGAALARVDLQHDVAGEARLGEVGRAPFPPAGHRGRAAGARP